MMKLHLNPHGALVYTDEGGVAHEGYAARRKSKR